MSDRAFVFVWLPEATEPVLAGQVIVVATGNGGWCRFKYASDYLGRPGAFALDPDRLPLEEGVFESEPDFELFNALRDASPDYWGRKVIEHRLGRTGLGEIDFLLAAGQERVGALGFGQTRALSPVARLPEAQRLEALAEAAEQVDADEGVDDRELLILLGEGSGTLGGMRPKVTVERDGRLWVAKFPAKDDRYDYVRMEYLALRLAEDAGIEVPEHRLERIGSRAILLTRRFDRIPESGRDVYRRHYLSGLSMTGLHERDHGAGAYADLADWLRRHAVDAASDCRELYRRMLFNIFIGNTDDHLRNHAVIRDARGYGLSPAFDLVPQPGLGGERHQAIGVGTRGRVASRDNALSEAARFGLDAGKAQAMAEKMADAVLGWEKYAADLELDRTTRRALEQAITPR